ncbi:Gfo/Idh/MocA family oxidoreductase [Planctobacterium marinum]|uniref:Oxidoreductase n=1 Tax=Planctobacterium marinum TaxID=1631968 RepID=A0AA48KTW2_9ALTE|nr:oxidoreductase [Planctobacterium marinum]
MINVALIGFGSIAQNLHLPLLNNHPELNLSAVSSSRPELVASKLPEAKCYASPDELLAASDADLVVVTTPNQYHYPLAMKALKSGRHVVVEKPVALHLKEIQDLQRQAEQQDVQLFPFHNRRWDGDFQTVAQLIANKQLGEIKRFESNFDRFIPAPKSKWKEQPGPGSGLWVDLGPHLLDQALYLFGSPEAITARVLNTRSGSAVDDYFNVQLHYADKEVLLAASNHNAAPVKRFDIQGTKGTFVKYGMDVQEEQLQAGMALDHESYGQDQENNHGTLYTIDKTDKTELETLSEQTIPTLRGSYIEFYEQVAQAIRYESQSPVSIKAAAEVARFLQLGLLSQKQGKTIKVRQYREE